MRSSPISPPLPPPAPDLRAAPFPGRVVRYRGRTVSLFHVKLCGREDRKDREGRLHRTSHSAAMAGPQTSKPMGPRDPRRTAQPHVRLSAPFHVKPGPLMPLN